MQPSHQPVSQSFDDASIGRTRDPAARMAGALLILTALASGVAVIGRVASDADQSTLAESLSAISLNGFLYGLGGAGRLVSGITLIAAAWYLSRLSTPDRPGVSLMSGLFAGSGLLTAVSGALAVVLVGLAPDAGQIVALSSTDRLVEVVATLRWMTGKIGFASAGLALIVVSRDRRRAGGALRNTAPPAAVTGIAMQFIWIDAATLVHRVVGVVFFVWLVASGWMLLAGRVDGASAPPVDRSS